MCLLRSAISQASWTRTAHHGQRSGQAVLSTTARQQLFVVHPSPPSMNHVPRRILAPAASDQSKWAYQDVPDGTDTDEVHTPLDVSKLAPPSRRPGSKPVVLISCGSFNPPTLSHCRMFEVAFDLLPQRGYEVLGGFLSPVNDGYGKPGLIPAPHRVAMCRHAVAAAPRIATDTWEARQTRYQRTLAVLQHFQQALAAAFPGAAARPMLLCGSDLLESFGQPGVWRPDHLRRIFTAHGCACLVRAGHDLAPLLAAEGSILFPFREHVEVLEDVVDVPISSSAIRAALMQRRSVKYLVPDSVISYIDEHTLYR